MSNPETKSKPSPATSSVGGGGSGQSLVRTFCRYCEKPEANQHEWDTMEGGEGCHLCWGECGVDADEALDRSRAEFFRLLSALRDLDRRMSGNELYEHGWSNYPEKPEKSPASYVRGMFPENVE